MSFWGDSVACRSRFFALVTTTSARTQAALARIAGGLSDIEMHAALSEEAERLGFRCVTLTWIDQSGLKRVMGDVPGQMIETFRRCRLDRFGPVTRRVMASPVPFHWKELHLDPIGDPLGHRVMSTAARAGMDSAFTIPIHIDGQAIGTVNFIGDVDLTERERCELQLLAHAAHTSMTRLAGMPPLQTLLTHREREVLKWTAMGKTAGDVATILGVSIRTVEFHMVNASRKLGTLNRVHTVVEAIKRQEITV